MARKKKLTERQKKAKQHARYVRSEYYKNIDAIDYLRDYIKIEPIKLSSKPTKRQLHIVQQIYKKAKSEIEKVGDYFVNLTTGELTKALPTKKQMVQEVRAERTQEYRQNRAEPEEPSDFNPDAQYLDAVREAIDRMMPRDAEDPKKASTMRKFHEAKLRLYGTLDYAISKTDEVTLAQSLAESDYVQRVISTDAQYAYEMEEAIDDDLIPLLEASMNNALDAYL